MNKRKLGLWLERKVAKMLEENGWAVHTEKPSFAFDGERYFTKPHDIFGADIIAMKNHHTLIFIQVTADSHISRRIRAFQAYPFPWNFVRVFVLQAKKNSNRWQFRPILVCDEKTWEEAPAITIRAIFGEKNEKYFFFQEEQ